MKQFDLQGNEYDCTIEIPLKKATYEDIQALNINLQTQLFVKDKEIERLNKTLEDIDTYIHLWKLDDIGEKTMLILNDILLIKNGMGDEVARLKGSE